MTKAANICIVRDKIICKKGVRFMKIGIQELLLVFIVALIVLGPDKLPLYARRFGEALREFRRFSSDATKDIRESIVEPLEEAQRPIREALEPIATLEKEIKGEVAGLQRSLSSIGSPVKKDSGTAAMSPEAGADRPVSDDTGSTPDTDVIGTAPDKAGSTPDTGVISTVSGGTDSPQAAGPSIADVGAPAVADMPSDPDRSDHLSTAKIAVQEDLS